MLTFNAILVLAALLFIVISLYKEIVAPAMTFIIAVGVLGVAQVLKPSEILSGFANEQIAVILMLLLLGDIYRRSSVLDILFDRVFKSAKTTRGFTTRMMLIVAPISSFMNNTPLVALMMPYTLNWSKRRKQAVSKLMMPLSFASILGGCATLIGTSTNLVVNSLVTDQHIVPNLPPLGIFEFTPVGAAMMIIGGFYMVFIGHKILPTTSGTLEKFTENNRSYVVEARIIAGSELIGKTIEESGLKKEQGIKILEIYRSDINLIDNIEEIRIQEGDIFLFAGNTHSIADLVESKTGIVIPSIGMFSKKKNTELVEIVVSHNSSMLNKTIREENFRAKYDATVIAVHRNGEILSGKTGDVLIKSGDAILLLAGSSFENRINTVADFYLISQVKEISRLGVQKTTYLVIGTLLTVILSAIGIIQLFNGLLFLITSLLLLKITNPKELVKGLDYELFLIIALSLALGTAMMKTGLAEFIASNILEFLMPLGKIGLLAGIYFITAIMAAFITNKAAVAVIFPISLSLALKLNVDTTPFILVVAYAAAANFMTPIGYQTNLMVYGPGGYKFKDFLKVGTPLTLIYMIVTVIILSLIYF